MAGLLGLEGGPGLLGFAGREQDRQDARLLKRGQTQRAQVAGEQEVLRGQLQKEQAAQLKPLLSQFGPDTAQQVGGLLTSGVPQAEALGAQMLQGLQQQRQGQDFTRAAQGPAARQDMAIAANKELRAQALFDTNAQDAVRQRDRDALTQQAVIIKAENDSSNSIRDDMRATFAPMSQMIIAGADVNALLDTGTALGGTGAIVKLAKALDPESVVRQSETGNLTGATGVVQILQDQWNRLGGEGMTRASMNQFREVVDKLLASRAQMAIRQFDGFRVDALASGLPEQRVDALFDQSGIDFSSLGQMVIRGMSDEELAAAIAEDRTPPGIGVGGQ